MTISWIDAQWPAPPNVHAGTTLRHGGVSDGIYASLNLGAHVADDAASVVENRRRFAEACGLPAEPVWLQQTHSVNVAVGAAPLPDPGTDAFISRKTHTVGVVLTADCLPVVFAAADGSEVAIAHAGWRGLCDGILEATLRGMATAPAGLLVWLGPAISQPAFEVGAEVRQQFVDHQSAAAEHFTQNERGRYQADLYGLAKQRLARAGLTAVFGGDRCTWSETADFFSYRRDSQCGRMATFVYRL